jgi:hypothetical protein
VENQTKNLQMPSLKKLELGRTSLSKIKPFSQSSLTGGIPSPAQIKASNS